MMRRKPEGRALLLASFSTLNTQELRTACIGEILQTGKPVTVTLWRRPAAILIPVEHLTDEMLSVLVEKR